MPKISIIIPAYNAEKYIRETIEEFLKNSFKDFEIIVVNDASTDNTEKITKKYCEKDLRIKIYLNNTNKGAAASRNVGIEKSSGKYLCFFDADDIPLSKRFEKQVDYLEKNEKIDFVYSDMIVFYPDGKEKYVKSGDFKKDPKILLMESFKKDISRIKEPAKLLDEEKFIPVGSVLVKKESIGDLRFDEDLRGAEDYDFWFNLILNGLKCKYLNLPTYKYRIHPGQKSKSKKRQESIKRILKKVKSGNYFESKPLKTKKT
jgi:glycosyltransferase involved in cell wall biosynthesis